MEPRSWLTPKRRCAVTCVRSHTSRESGVEAELLEHDYSLFFAFFFSRLFIIHFKIFSDIRYSFYSFYVSFPFQIPFL